MEKCGLSRSEYVANQLALDHGCPLPEVLGPSGKRTKKKTRSDDDDSSSAHKKKKSPTPPPEPESSMLVAQVDHAASESGLTPMEFAGALGVSASRMATYRSGARDLPAGVYVRAMRLSDGLRRAREHGWLSPANVGATFRLALADMDDRWALDLCLQTRDDLRRAFALDKAAVTAWEGAPGTSGRMHWDVLLAAVIAHEFVEHDHVAPNWTQYARLRLDRAWVLANSTLSPKQVRANTPAWLAAHKVFVARHDLGDAQDPAPTA